MLQNRVDPFGELIRTKHRGTFMGNRGLIHNDRQQIVRPFRLKAWITCLLEFKGWHREVMSPGKYTELFFWDEATSFAAGHRPCAECRRTAFDHFKTCWLKGNPEYGFDKKTSIKEIDNIIHEERIGLKFEKIFHKEPLKSLPDGTFVVWNDEPYLLYQQKVFKWTAAGYEDGSALPATKLITVLTPASVVNAFRAGYQPGVLSS